MAPSVLRRFVNELHRLPLFCNAGSPALITQIGHFVFVSPSGKKVFEQEIIEFIFIYFKSDLILTYIGNFNN